MKRYFIFAAIGPFLGGFLLLFAERMRRGDPDLNTEYVDERLTTVSAERMLAERGVRGPRRRQVVDQVAATRILQNRLDALAGAR